MRVCRLCEPGQFLDDGIPRSLGSIGPPGDQPALRGLIYVRLLFLRTADVSGFGGIRETRRKDFLSTPVFAHRVLLLVPECYPWIFFRELDGDL